MIICERKETDLDVSMWIIVKVNLKRLPAQPREARHVSTKHNVPQTIAPVPYETLL